MAASFELPSEVTNASPRRFPSVCAPLLSLAARHRPRHARRGARRRYRLGVCARGLESTVAACSPRRRRLVRQAARQAPDDPGCGVGTGRGDALHFASDVLTTSKSGYGLDSGDLAVVICLRHGATAVAFNDAMWAKYSAPLSARAKLNDPKTHAPAVVNVYNSTEYGGLLSNGSATIDALIKQGVHFAVCDQSTHGYAGGFARTTDGKADTVYKELTSNLIGNSHMVPSGIVAVGHAQEHGYAYAYCG